MSVNNNVKKRVMELTLGHYLVTGSAAKSNHIENMYQHRYSLVKEWGFTWMGENLRKALAVLSSKRSPSILIGLRVSIAMGTKMADWMMAASVLSSAVLLLLPLYWCDCVLEFPIVWRAMRRAGIPSIKELLGLLQDDGKRPDGVTMIPWRRGRCVAWNVTVPDTFAATHLTPITPSAAADRAATNKKMKYQLLTQTHTFTPLAVETTGAFNTEASKFIQDIGRRCTEATRDIKETAYLFQQVSVAIQRGNYYYY